MEIIPAKTIIDALTLTHDQKIQRFNEMVQAERDKLLKKKADDNTFRVELLFSMFGNNNDDIQCIIDQGYEVYKGCLDDRWVVGLFQSRLSVLDPQITTSRSVIPTAAEVQKSMTSIEDRRKAVFKKRVDEERNKTEPTDFLIRLRFNEFGEEDDGIQFIRNLGYIVTEGIRGDHCWNVTLPE